MKRVFFRLAWLPFSVALAAVITALVAWHIFVPFLGWLDVCLL